MVVDLGKLNGRGKPLKNHNPRTVRVEAPDVNVAHSIKLTETSTVDPQSKAIVPTYGLTCSCGHREGGMPSKGLAIYGARLHGLEVTVLKLASMLGAAVGKGNATTETEPAEAPAEEPANDDS